MVKKYPDEILKLQHPAGFRAEFHNMIRVSKTNEQAYEKVEEKHEYYFGKRKYASYHSFANIQSQRKKLK